MRPSSNKNQPLNWAHELQQRERQPSLAQQEEQQNTNGREEETLDEEEARSVIRRESENLNLIQKLMTEIESIKRELCFQREEISKLRDTVQSRLPLSSDCTSILPSSKPFSRKPIGLNNFAQSCYMNVVLQCLLNIPPLVEFVTLNQFLTTWSTPSSSGPGGGSGGAVVRAFRDFINEVQTAKEPVTPRSLKFAIDQFMPNFDERRQRDAFEFLVQFLNQLHLDLKFYHSNNSIIAELFYSKIEVKFEFVCCNAVQISPNPPVFCMLPVPSRSRNIDLKDCFEIWNQVQRENSENHFWCPSCKRETVYRMQMRVCSFAKYAIFRFLRFSERESGAWGNMCPVKYPVEFKSSEFVPGSTGRYRLIGVICHTGTQYSGHYTCVIRLDAASAWYLISDATVSEIRTTDGWKRDDADSLFYERINP